MEKLELLQELNISGNQLKCLPEVLGALPKLVVLRAHSNYLSNLPDFKKAAALRVRRFCQAGKIVQLSIIKHEENAVLTRLRLRRCLHL